MKARDAVEISMAHDVLSAVASEMTPLNTQDEDSKLIMAIAADALCWVLGRESSLEGLLAEIKSGLNEHEFEIIPDPSMVN